MGCDQGTPEKVKEERGQKNFVGKKSWLWKGRSNKI